MSEVKVPCGGFKLGGGIILDRGRLTAATSSIVSMFYWKLSDDKEHIEFNGIDFDLERPVKISVPINFIDKEHDEKMRQVRKICTRYGISTDILPLKFYRGTVLGNLTLSPTGDSVFDWGSIVRNIAFKKLQYVQVYIDSNGLHELVTDIGTLS